MSYPAWSVYLDDRISAIGYRLEQWWGFIFRSDQRYLYKKLADINTLSIKLFDENRDMRLTIEAILKDKTTNKGQKLDFISKKLGLTDGT